MPSNTNRIKFRGASVNSHNLLRIRSSCRNWTMCVTQQYSGRSIYRLLVSEPRSCPVGLQGDSVYPPSCRCMTENKGAPQVEAQLTNCSSIRLMVAALPTAESYVESELRLNKIWIIPFVTHFKREICPKMKRLLPRLT